MPSNDLKIRFRHPTTGQSHEVSARLLEQKTHASPKDGRVPAHDRRDGTVDLFVTHPSGSSYSPRTETLHLQVDASALSAEQAAALAEAMTGNRPDAIELSSGPRFNAVTIRSDLWVERPDIAPAFDASKNLGDDAAPVFLDEQGHFHIGNQAAAEVPQALFRAAELADGLSNGQNLFSTIGASLAIKEGAFEQLRMTLDSPSMQAATPDERTQIRSSSATLLTELIDALGNTGDEGALKRKAVGVLDTLVRTETVGGLRESMVFHGLRVQGGLPQDVAPLVGEWKAMIAPSSPPYETWFADGKNEVNISLAAGHGEGFYEGLTEFFSERGFVVTQQEESGGWLNGGKDRILSLTRKDPTGEDRSVHIHLRDFQNDTFDEMDEAQFDVVAYLGHSQLGANTRNALARAPDVSGDGKLIFLGLCSGKDNLDRVRKAFPDAQLMTTYNSSYFQKRSLPGGGDQFRSGEDAKAIVELVNGIFAESSWSEINEAVRERAVGWNHDKARGNYITPIDLRMNARFRDQDRDGRADLVDRHFHVDTLAVDAQPAASLQPSLYAPSSESPLNGELVHTAAVFANTIDLYNPTFAKFHKQGRVIADGYFRGRETDPVVRFVTKTVDGEKAFALQLNDAYRGIGEEALRAITLVEYNRHLASTEPEGYPTSDPVRRELVGLLTAAASLTYDQGYSDRAVFQAIVRHYGFPESLRWSDAKKLIDDEHHDYTGSLRMADRWLAQLTPDEQADVKEKLNGEPLHV